MPKPDIVRITVTDGEGSSGNFDGATATATMKMTVHRGIELLPSKRANQITSGPFKGTYNFAYWPATIHNNTSDPNHPTELAGDADVQIEYADIGWELLGGTMTMVEGILDYFEADPRAKLSMVASGLVVDNIKPAESTYHISFLECWHQPYGSKGANMPNSNFTTPGGQYFNGWCPKLDAIEAHWQFIPHVEQAYTYKWNLADSYGGDGFDGETKVAVFSPASGFGYAWGQFTEYAP